MFHMKHVVWASGLEGLDSRLFGAAWGVSGGPLWAFGRFLGMPQGVLGVPKGSLNGFLLALLGIFCFSAR